MVRAARLSALALSALVTTACVLDRQGQLDVAPGSGGNTSAQGGAGAVGGVGGFGNQGGGGGVLDRPPNPVEDLGVVVDGDVDITWTNPSEADLAGVLVVHRPGQEVSFAPVDGLSYTEGTEVMANQTVIFSSLGETATLSPAVPGLEHHFAAWAVDEAGQYSAVRVADGLNNALGTQTAQIEVALDGTVTVNQQPANFPLAGTAVYDDPSNFIDVTLSARNDTARVVFNLKGKVSSLNQGSYAGDMLPGETTPYVYYGPEGLDVAASAQRTFRIDNIDGATDPITFEIDFVDAPWLISKQRDGRQAEQTQQLLLVDSSGGSSQDFIDATPGPTTGFTHRGIVLSRDARRAYVGGKAAPFVTAVDLVKRVNNLGADLGGGSIGMVSGVALSPDGEQLYAALTLGCHHWGTIGDQANTQGTSTDVALVELDPSTLMETQRLSILSADTTRRMSRKIVVNGDGTMAAIMVRQANGSGLDAEIYFVDLATFMLVDTNTATVEVDPVIIVGDVRPDDLLFNDGGGLLYVTTRNNAAIEVIELTDFSTSTLTPANPMQRAHSLFLLDDALWLGSDDITVTTGGTGLTSFALADDSETVINPGFGEVRTIVGNDMRYYVLGQTQAAVYDATTNARIDMDGNGANGNTNLVLRSGLAFSNHFGVVTPF